MSAPILLTDRLLLRPHRLDDHPAMVALWSDPAVTGFILPEPASPEATWSRLLRYTGHWAQLGYGYWVLECRETGAYLGEAGLADYRRALVPPADLAPEAGWVLAAAAQGRGLAREAMRAVLCWADQRLALPVNAIIVPGHLASLRMAADLGFAELARPQYAGRPTVLLRRAVGGQSGCPAQTDAR